jgi:hypothetical protein
MDISSMLGGNSSMSDTFIDASFGVNFSEQSDGNDILSAVTTKIKAFARNKCSSYGGSNCYSENIT